MASELVEPTTEMREEIIDLARAKAGNLDELLGAEELEQVLQWIASSIASDLGYRWT